jgi:hypothetical protein
MPGKLEARLKAQGYSDADLETLRPMLSDERFRGTLEALAEERDTLADLNEQWKTKLDNEYNPAITRSQKEAEDARLEAARLREVVKIAKDYGYVTDENTPPPPPDPKTQHPNFDPTKFVTHEDVGRFAEAEGQAIAMVADLNEEYRHLYGGKSLFDYAAQTQDGRTLRGMSALREEAKAARKPLNVYVAEKFKFSDKRTEMETARQKERDAQIEKEAVAKYVAEHGGNPNMTIPAASRQPFIPAKTKDTDLPWNRGTPDQNKNARIERAVKREAQQSIH